MDHSPTRIRTEIPGPSTTTQTEVIQPGNVTPEPPVLHLQLQKPKSEKKVAWRSGTIDNENMNKKKSKCCCIYKKQQAFGESSSEEEEDCEHCYGHVEKRKQKKPLLDDSEPKEDHCSH